VLLLSYQNKRKMLFNTIIGLIFLVIPYVSTLSPLSLTKPVTDGFGINIHFTHPKAGELEMIAEAGFKWVRMDFLWDSTEKKKGEYDFKDFEFLMTELEKHNMSAIFILDYGNKLYDKPTAVTTDVGRKAYAQWAATAVDHFKGRGILWEIWNEPNGNGFWNGHANVHEYIPMALEAVKAIRAKTPSEIIIGPATSGVDHGFLEECFKAGLLDYWDAVSVHPYRRSKPETVLSDYNKLKNAIAKHAPKEKNIPIISGEWGYSAAWQLFNETVQGKYLPRELLTNVLNDIPISIWYDWHNDSTNKTDFESNFGTVFNEYQSGANPVYKPKEAYLSAKTMYTVLKGCHFVKRIATNDLNDYVMLFSDGKNLRLVSWTTSTKEHEIKIPSDNCDFDLIHHKGSPVEHLSAKDGSLTLKLNDFTHFIIVKGPNHALETAPEVILFKADIEPIHGKSLSIKVQHLIKKSFDGTLKLTDIKGIEPNLTETKLLFGFENEKDIRIPLKSKPENEFTVGFSFESNGSVQNIPALKYQFAANQTITDCNITADGNKTVESEQSISLHSAPEPLFDSDLPVMKIDYHFYGQGSKFLDVNINKAEYRKIAGQPKAFGLWIFGDNQKISIKMRIVDNSHQYFQLHPESGLTVDWNGWKYVTFYLNDPEIHWGGSNDGVVRYPVEYQTLFLIDNKIDYAVKSSIYITSPVVIY
jgi:hypothetical protein